MKHLRTYENLHTANLSVGDYIREIKYGNYYGKSEKTIYIWEITEVNLNDKHGPYFCHGVIAWTGVKYDKKFEGEWHGLKLVNRLNDERISNKRKYRLISKEDVDKIVSDYKINKEAKKFNI